MTLTNADKNDQLCQDCKQFPRNCVCPDESSGIDPVTLSYVKESGKIPESLIRRLKAEYRENKSQYDKFDQNRQSVEVTPQSIRRAMAWVVVTIKTDTERVDARSDLLLSGNFRNDKSFVTQSTDGKIKWEKVHKWLTSDIPDRVADYLNRDRVNDAHALLAGRDPETGKQVTIEGQEATLYLRTCKASLVLYLTGFDRMCIDSRIFRAIEPALSALMEGKKSHADTALENPYRDSSPRMDAKAVPVVSHSGDLMHESGKTFLEDKLAMNPPEYDALTGFIRERLADETGIPESVIPQVAFNLQDETTTHGPLMERLAG